MALRKVRSNLDRLFDKSLSDLIRGIRNNKDNEARYIAACIEEIKVELRQDPTFVKANAVEKLAYLQMMGYDISWASFNIIEVMASTKFTEKRIGYLTAAQCFHDDTDVLMLATNMIRKDLHSSSMYDTGVALGALSCFVTTDLARDLAHDIVNLLSSTRPYIRKRAVLLLYKMFLKYPESLRPTFPRLKEKLEDADPGVQSAAVNVICELARKNPKNYLTLAPIFFKLMTTSSNNWMLIKIIKLFGALVPLEPRLGKKLLEPLTNLINSSFSTSAMSLLYECINTVIAVLISVSSGVPGDHTASIQLCVQKLGVLIEDSDQNLKYLGLLAMGKILQYHPKAVQAHKDIMLRCLDDRDESIRLRALDLLYGMVSKKNIMEIIRKLMDHVDAAEGSFYRDELLSRIISICSYNNYQHITNFEWYISVLVELTKVEGTKHGSMIAQQMQDVTVRVQSIRHFAVSQMALLVENAHLLLAGSEQHRSNISEVLLAAAWICGEYAEHVCNPQSALESMLRTKTNVMPGHILSVYVQNIGKLYSFILLKAEADQDWDAVESLDNLMLSKMPQFELCDHLEAQERACTLLATLRVVEQFHAKREVVGEDFAKLFEGELSPVAPKAQRKVPIPDGLDLEKWIHEPPPSDELEEAVEMDEDIFGRKGLRSEFTRFGYSPRFSSDEDEEGKLEKPNPKKEAGKEPVGISQEELDKRREKRRAEIETNPYYVKGDSKVSSKRPTKFVTLGSVEKSEPAIIELQSPLEIPGVVGLDRYMEQQQSTLSWKAAKKEKKSKKGKKTKTARVALSSSEDDELTIVHQVNRADGEMPENAKSTDEEETENEDEMDAVCKALDFDLEQSLREEKERRELSEASPARKAASPQHVLPPGLNGSAGSPTPYGNITPTAYADEAKTTKKAKKTKEPGARKEKSKKKVAQKQDISGEIATEPHLVGVSTDLSGKVDLGIDLSQEIQKTKKKEKKKDTKKRSKKGTGAEVLTDHGVYEVASGVCTPTMPTTAVNGKSSVSGGIGFQENTGISNGSPPPKLSSYRTLAENNRLRLTYEVQAQNQEGNEVSVGVVFTNKGSRLVRQMEMNILGTLNARLVRDSEYSSMGGVPLSFQLPPGVASENIFKFTVDAMNVSQKLRGTLTYFVDEVEGPVEDKLDFHLLIPTTTFTVPATIGNDAYEVLLASGDLESKSSTQFETSLTWNDLISRICFYGHFSVVEQQEGFASLYAHHIAKPEPVCLLVKLKAGRVSIDGRSGDQQLIFALLNDLREIISP